jgi:hypothetical protein
MAVINPALHRLHEELGFSQELSASVFLGQKHCSWGGKKMKTEENEKKFYIGRGEGGQPGICSPSIF